MKERVLFSHAGQRDSQFRLSNAGEPIAPVDPVALKGSWSTRKEPLTYGVVKPAQREEAAG